MVRFSPPPKELVVARVHADPEPSIDLEPAHRVVVTPGTPVVIKVLYRLEDLPSLEEHTRIRFESDVRGAGPEPSTAKQDDRPGLGDAVWGYLGQRHVFHQPGTYSIRFLVHVERDLLGWTSVALERHLYVSKEGEVAVSVLPGPQSKGLEA